MASIIAGKKAELSTEHLVLLILFGILLIAFFFILKNKLGMLLGLR